MKSTRMQNGEWIDTLCSTGDGAFIVDDNSQIIRWNKPAESILQYSEPEVLNQKCYQIFSGKTSAGTIHCRPDCKVQSNVEKASQENFDIETRTKDGKVLWQLSRSGKGADTRRRKGQGGRGKARFKRKGGRCPG